MRGSSRHCSCEVRGIGRPAAAQACEVSPEQSYEPGPVAPQTYGLPIWALAKATAARPAAGKRLPPSGNPGGPRMELVISNDAPNGVEVLYTGPVTGTVTLKPCGDCKRYSAATGSTRACKVSGRNYPKARLQLPAGDYHFLYKHGTGASSRVDSYAAGSKVRPGYTYTSCTYVIERSLLEPRLPTLPDLLEPTSLSLPRAGSSR